MQPLATSTCYEPHRHHCILGHLHDPYRSSDHYFLDQVSKHRRHSGRQSPLTFFNTQTKHFPPVFFFVEDALLRHLPMLHIQYFILILLLYKF